MTPRDIRRRLWADYVRRATDHALAVHGWSVPTIAKRAGISPATIYRWLNQEWEKSPKGEQVEAFCDALGIPTTDALKILFPGKAGEAVRAEPMPIHPDAERIMRKLNDPKTAPDERRFLNESLRMLALRR